jgi:hypothetical protein
MERATMERVALGGAVFVCRSTVRLRTTGRTLSARSIKPPASIAATAVAAAALPGALRGERETCGVNVNVKDFF